MGTRLLGSLLCAAVLPLLSSCGDCSEEIEAARKFLHENRACEMDADCVAVNTGCHSYANGLCGQAPLNSSAATSPTWKKLSADLVDCDDPCSLCLALLIPRCNNGLCGGPP
jgi:hypothetical protein